MVRFRFPNSIRAKKWHSRLVSDSQTLITWTQKPYGFYLFHERAPPYIKFVFLQQSWLVLRGRVPESCFTERWLTTPLENDLEECSCAWARQPPPEGNKGMGNRYGKVVYRLSCLHFTWSHLDSYQFLINSATVVQHDALFFSANGYKITPKDRFSGMLSLSFGIRKIAWLKRETHNNSEPS